jgi:hypothetical protein
MALGPFFRCFLDAVGDWDGRSPDRPRDDPTKTVVQPRSWYQSQSTIPAELLHRAPCRGKFLPGYPLLWVEEIRTRALFPYWVPRAWAGLMSTLCPAERPPPHLPEPVVQALSKSNVLVDPALEEERGERRAEMLHRSACSFSADGYVNLHGLMPAAHARALGAFYRAIVETGTVRLGDPQCDRRFGLYGDSMARFFQHQLKAVVEWVVGEQVVPSYVYVAYYQPGATLECHTDREQCQFTLAVLADFSPEPVGPSPWPLWFSTPRGDIPLAQAIGDGVVFRGRELPHWRDALEAGQTSTSLLLHYVSSSFTGSLR